MNRRQRKKLRRGEFQECGFAVQFVLRTCETESQIDAFWDIAVAQIESLGLAIGGGTGRRWDVFVTTLSERGSVSKAKRAALNAWLENRPEVATLRVGALVDAWVADNHLDRAS